MKNSGLKGNEGFSIIELLVGMVVTLIMLGGVAALIVGLNTQLKSQRVRLTNLENAQFAADTMARIIRMSGARPNTCVSTFTVPAAAPSGSLANNYYSQVAINADWNPGDCALTGTEENVTFSVANNSFYEDAARANAVVDGISAVRFQFYDRSGVLMTAPDTAPGSIGYVRIEVDTASQNGAPILTIVSGAAIRN